MEVLSDFTAVQQEYQYRVIQKRDQYIGLLSKIGAIISVTFVTMFLVDFLTKIKFMNVPVRIIFTVSFLIMIGFYFIFEYGKTGNIYYHYLLPHLIKKYSQQYGLQLKYNPNIKKDKEINVNGGLFNRAAANTLKYRISGQIEHVPFTIDQSYVFVSTGKTTTVYLNGAYLFIGIVEPNFIQVRDKHKPHLKGVKLIRNSSDQRVFTINEEAGDQRYVSLFDYVKTLDSSTKVYLSANNSGLHIGIDKYLLKAPGNLTESLYKDLYHKLSQLLDIIKYVKSEFSDAF